MKQFIKFSYCLLLFILILTLPSIAQDVKVSAKLDKTTIALGDQTILRLSVIAPVKSIVTFPMLTDTITSKIQIVESGTSDTLVDANNPSLQTLNRTYTITSFEAGLHMIPGFTFKTKDGELKTEALPLEVSAVQVDTTKAIFDIKQPLAVSYSFFDWLRDNWYWLAGAVVMLGLLVYLVYYLKKRKVIVPEVQQPKKPELPLHVETLNKLNSLKERKIWELDRVKEYHVELTDILREYLEKRYGINAPEQTSDEIFESTRNLEIDEQSRGKLRQVLVLADLVKFAKASPNASDNERSIENAIDFVTGTTETVVTTEKNTTDGVV